MPAFLRIASAKWIRLLFVIGCAPLMPTLGLARPPAVPAEASKAEVIKLLGWPNGQSTAGNREILSYAQGQVILEDGRVVRVDFSPKIPWQAPKAAPAPASATSARSRQALQAWSSDFEQAKHDAAQLGRPILVLFTGPATPVRTPRFFEDVAVHPEFVAAFGNEFVLLRVEAGTQPALREACEVAQYPTVVFLSPSGDIIARSESFPPPTAAARSRIIASVRDAWVAAGGTLGKTAGASRAPPASGEMGGWVKYGWDLIISGLGAGVVIMLLLLWLLWRKWSVPQPTLPEMRNRISDAALGLPALAEVHAWTQKKVCAVAAGVAAADGFLVDTYKLGDNADLELRHPGDKRPAILVLAVGGGEGPLRLARLRDFTAEMESFKVREGWVLAPAGFDAEAVAYGHKRKLTLLNAEAILQRLRDMPPLSLPAVLAQTNAGPARPR